VLRITPGERSALQLLADGKATDEVASCLGISERDIDRHLATLFARMGAANRSEAVVAAGRRGLLESATVRADYVR
jgi:DNA-binding CsgD family transcriptional regulator